MVHTTQFTPESKKAFLALAREPREEFWVHIPSIKPSIHRAFY